MSTNFQQGLEKDSDALAAWPFPTPPWSAWPTRSMPWKPTFVLWRAPCPRKSSRPWPSGGPGTSHASRGGRRVTLLETAAALRRRDVSSAELTAAALQRIERLNPSTNAMQTVHGRRRPRAGQTGRPGPGAGRRPRPAAWHPHCGQGSVPHQRRAHHRRLEAVRGSCAGL